MLNIQKFKDGSNPTGKVLIYSDFRGDSGGEIVEQVLKNNGYSLYDPSVPPTNSLKYTFITGEEGSDKRKLNMALDEESLTWPLVTAKFLESFDISKKSQRKNLKFHCSLMPLSKLSFTL